MVAVPCYAYRSARLGCSNRGIIALDDWSCIPVPDWFQVLGGEVGVRLEIQVRSLGALPKTSY